MHVPCSNQHDPVPVHYTASRVCEERTVCISIEGDSQVSAHRFRFLGHHFGVQRATAFVDVASIGSHVREMDLPPEQRKKFGGDQRRRSVGVVNGDLLTGKTQPGNSATQVRLVFL